MNRRVRGLVELARLYGVETAYVGMGGTRHRADDESLALTLRALGVQLDDAADAMSALNARRAQLDATSLQPVHVAWDGRLSQLRLRLPATQPETVSVEVRLEAGNVSSYPCRAEPASIPARRGWQPTHTLRLGLQLPIGYHRITVETAGETFESLIIAAPRHAYAPESAREWGLFVPLYALCAERSHGIGDYSDLAGIARWSHGLGAGFLSTLPLLASFLDAPFDPSPYAPVSRLFWNELFVDIAAVPGAAEAGTPDALPCRTDEHVDYRHVAARRRAWLERACRASADDTAVTDALARFTASNPHAHAYAQFRAVCDRRRDGWHVWPDRLRDGDIRTGDFAADDYAYHLFAQWQADAQLAALAADDDAAAPYLDLPLGVHADGYDAWRFRELFAEGVSAGAPPDALFTGGQDWGFRPLDPGALRASGYAYFIDTLRHHLRHARILRLDHVMSLYRLYWVPHGLSAQRGVYVRYAEDELYAVLTLESARHRAVVIGEDLGTVPVAVRRAMDRHHVHRMHVVQFEASADRSPAAAAPDPNVVASLNTHDMPTFAGFWRGSEIDDQLELGLIDEAGHAAAQAERKRLRLALSRDVGAGGEIDAGLTRQRLLERLAASPARYVLLTLEDLWLERRPQNVPGTSAERPNWRRRAAYTLDRIMSDAALRRMLNAVAGHRRPAQHTDRTAHG
ncbi:4-alpha-glucanotransferase [soil metagenome]